jgi:hypothetical protein
VSSLPTRLGLAAAAGIVALIALGTTLWFLGDALMLLLEEKGFGPPGAAGLTGLAGLVVVLLLGLAARLAMRSPRRRAATAAATAPPPGVNGVANGIAADLGALAAQQIVNSTRAHPYGTVGAALVAGLAVGAVPELRKFLMGLFKQ